MYFKNIPGQNVHACQFTNLQNNTRARAKLEISMFSVDHLRGTNIRMEMLKLKLKKYTKIFLFPPVGVDHFEGADSLT